MGGAAEEGEERETEAGEAAVTGKPGGTGCVLAMLGLNALLIGLLAFSFSQGPYSSREQEVWYRFGSIGFLVAGVVLPGIALWFGAMRSQLAITALVVWMFAVLMACVVYALFSGGGV
jgi:hypothetical protein